MTAPTVLHPAPVGRAPNAAPAVGAPQLTVVVPTFNEAGNVEPLLRRLGTSLSGLRAEVLFVDDSTDGTDRLAAAQDGKHGSLPVRVRHREVPTGGLSGAVAEGLRAARGAYVVVMDGDLQHPPELTPELYRQGLLGADLVVASRHMSGGDAAGLSGVRRAVSGASHRLARLLFPARLRGCTDTMSGFFCVRRERVDVERIPLHGYKLLLALLVSHELRVAEVGFRFAPRHTGESKATILEGLRFVRLLVALRWRHRAHPGPVAFASDSRIGAQVSDAAGRTPCDRLFRGRAAQRR